jgi:hypothetical protein
MMFSPCWHACQAHVPRLAPSWAHLTTKRQVPLHRSRAPLSTFRRTSTASEADGKPDQAAQGATGVRLHVVSQSDRRPGAARTPHRGVLADHCVRSAIPQTNPLARCEHLGRAEGVVRAIRADKSANRWTR